MTEINEKTEMEKGISGLANLGNTCFMNTCLQILSHTKELNALLDTDYKPNNNKEDSILLIEWDALRKLLWNHNCVVTPGKFVKAVQYVAHKKNNTQFVGYIQNDVSEFLMFIIDCFHNALARKVNMVMKGTPRNDTDTLAIKCYSKVMEMYSKDYSEIWNLFYGIQVSLINNPNGENVGINPEPYFMINLPIPKKDKNEVTLYDCFNEYIKSETIEGYKDENTNSSYDAEKKTQFWSFPTILTLDLKRFVHGTGFRKNQVCVQFPLENLNLSNYAIGYKSNQYVYDLYGVCMHSGSLHGGHYTACVKSSSNKWYHFNDTSISEIPNPEVIVNPRAYVLFYRKREAFK